MNLTIDPLIKSAAEAFVYAANESMSALVERLLKREIEGDDGGDKPLPTAKKANMPPAPNTPHAPLERHGKSRRKSPASTGTGKG